MWFLYSILCGSPCNTTHPFLLSGKCTNKCTNPLSENYVNENFMCQNSCAMNFQHFIYTFEKVEITYKLCVSECKSFHVDSECFDSCQYSYRFRDYLVLPNKSCSQFCLGLSSKLSEWRVDGERQCVESCAANCQFIDPNTVNVRTCVQLCAPNLYCFIQSMRLCSKNCAGVMDPDALGSYQCIASCPPERPYEIATNDPIIGKICVATQSCDYKVGVPDSYQCQNYCDKFVNIIAIDDVWCVDGCANLTFELDETKNVKICRENCSYGTFRQPLENGYTQCVPRCQSKMFDEKFNCVEKCDDFLLFSGDFGGFLCQTEFCRTNVIKILADPAGKMCVQADQCELVIVKGGSPPYDVCQETCPSNLGFVEEQYCVEKCAKFRFYSVTGTVKKCVEACQKYNQLIDSNKLFQCKLSCPLKLAERNKTCTPVCNKFREKTEFADQHYYCQDTCLNFKFAALNGSSKTCTLNCDAFSYVDTYSYPGVGICQNECSHYATAKNCSTAPCASGVYELSNSVKSCISRENCAKFFQLDENVGSLLFVCAASCNTPFHFENRTCSEVCAGFVQETSVQSSLCLSFCPIYEVVNSQKRCRAECGGSQFKASNFIQNAFQCVDVCPGKLADEQKVCVDSCDKFVKNDPITAICAKQCEPNIYQAVDSTLVCAPTCALFFQYRADKKHFECVESCVFGTFAENSTCLLKKTSQIGLIVGLVVGFLLLVVAITVAVFLFFIWNKNKKQKKLQNNGKFVVKTRNIGFDGRQINGSIKNTDGNSINGSSMCADDRHSAGLNQMSRFSQLKNGRQLQAVSLDTDNPFM